MEKRLPPCQLLVVKALVGEGRVHFTFSALETVQRLVLIEAEQAGVKTPDLYHEQSAATLYSWKQKRSGMDVS